MDYIALGALVATPVCSAISAYVGAAVRLVRTEERVAALNQATRNLSVDVREIRAQVNLLHAQRGSH